LAGDGLRQALGHEPTPTSICIGYDGVNHFFALAPALASDGIHDIVSTLAQGLKERFIRDGRQWQSLPPPFTAPAALLHTQLGTFTSRGIWRGPACRSHDGGRRRVGAADALGESAAARGLTLALAMPVLSAAAAVAACPAAAHSRPEVQGSPGCCTRPVHLVAGNARQVHRNDMPDDFV
jgi:hypothetical protein